MLGDLARRLGPRILRAPKRLDQAARQLDEYFAGRRRAFDLPLDRRLSTGFRDRVQRLLPEIPYGSTRTYREVAETAGSPAANARGRHGVLDEPAARRDPLPPRPPLRRHARRLHRRARGEDDAAGAGGAVLTGLRRARPPSGGRGRDARLPSVDA